MLCGCSKYQYAFISSHLYQNDKKEFINENDTVLIKYTFSGENFPITLTIYNKLQQPLYIDWERSVVIINNIQLNSSFYRDGQVSFIAPLSYVTVSSNSLKQDFIKLDSEAPGTKVAITGNSTQGMKYSYNEESSPLFFRNILALTTNENYSASTFFDYSFWVSDIIETSAGPSSMTYNTPNEFFISKKTLFGKIFGWTLACTTILILIALPGL